ncbi:MAG: hypothetical protein UT86_C0004G0038 [Candidatus Magasanikbacteria bacterium GW2011_GWC2_40_17]|uniref:Uncharacterized protein n=1 Tax=Candidatus Magasanikbacteria bacterium GW2011_GWA2_42_32 TaxID=1619039 RepID=A0A0G1D513_9BACT|nr:MAG: hypothetical protein UT86_C0004G0038 [Candidatus Magasanikbacteria bacterium GW2011_GWC2_40_17]KKS57098.1 MAG: hypothetical protein UV20_C0003G0038 [Candidatus Magasanikbacteria bacterium GW2011_GWA2_42_32]
MLSAQEVLALMEEVSVRLNRGQDPEQFAQDLREFLRNPALWRESKRYLVSQAMELLGTAEVLGNSSHMEDIYSAMGRISSSDFRQALCYWMQGVYFTMGIQCEVPLPPALTSRQKKSLKKYGLRLFYIPAITEAEYPESFIKPDWGKLLTVSSIESKPLLGRWVVIETIPKPSWDDPVGYTNDTLAQALKLVKRFAVSWDDLYNEDGFLTKIAKITGLPKHSTRLPTAEEWNFLGNLFLWLNANRKENLPDFGSTSSWEWTENLYDFDNRVVVGSREDGGLADVDDNWHNSHNDSIAFRVLAVL